MRIWHSCLHLPCWLPLLLLLLLAAVPLQAADCDEFDDLAFTFLEIGENGLITWDDLSIAGYEVMNCEIDGPPYHMGCDLTDDYFTVTTPSYQIPDFDAESVYWSGVSGLPKDVSTKECYIPGIAKDYWPPSDEPVDENVIDDPPPADVLLPPENVAFDPGGTTVTWDDVTDADGYIVEWRQDADDPWTRVNNDDTSYDIPNFDTAVPYSVRILTVNTDDVAGPASDIVDWTPPGAPQNLRINSDGRVTWDEEEEANHYLTGWNKHTGNSAQFRAQAGNQMEDQRTDTNQYYIPDFNPGSDYDADTRTVNEFGAWSQRSFARYNPPPSPSNLMIDEYGEVTWDAVTEAVHYLVDWIKGPSPWSRENLVTTNSFSIPDFDAASDYIVTVRSVNVNDVESYPPIGKAWVPPTVGPPEDVKISSVGFVHWDAADDATGYEANWKLTDGLWSPFVIVDAADPLNFTIPNFDAELVYEVRVRSLLAIGNATIYSDYAYQDWPMPVSVLAREIDESGGSGDSEDVGAIDPRDLCRVSPHNGSSLIVWDCNNMVEARSGEEGTSLFTSERCSGFTTRLITSSTTIEIWCNTDNHYLVIELVPQHPQDARRDMLVFDDLVTECYRAYQYLATGTIEVWHTACR